MVNKTMTCMNCVSHFEIAATYKTIIKNMLKKIPKSELANLLLELKIIEIDPVTNTKYIKTKCKCGNPCVGYIGVTGEEQKAICQYCLDKFVEKSESLQ